MLFNSTNQTNFGWDLGENLNFEARSDEVGPSGIEGEAWTRNHIKFPFTNKMHKENHAADRVLKLQWVTSPRHLVFECAKLRRPHSESRLLTWPLTFTPLLALSLICTTKKHCLSDYHTAYIGERRRAVLRKWPSYWVVFRLWSNFKDNSKGQGHSIVHSLDSQTLVSGTFLYV